MGKFKKGDYLVSNEAVLNGRDIGEIVKLTEDQSGEDMVVFTSSRTGKGYGAKISNNSFRRATAEEIQFYMEEDRGCNIKDMDKSFDSNTKFKKGDKIVVRGDMKRGITFGTHHFPENRKYIPYEELTVKRVNRRREYIPLERQYLKLHEDMLDFELSKEANKTLDSFPTSGWCRDYDEDILRFLGKKAKKNILEECKSKDKCGVAWTHYAGNDSWNVWYVVGASSKAEYTKEQLRKLVPTTSCIDTKGSFWNLVGGMDDYKDLSLSAIGINEDRMGDRIDAINYGAMEMHIRHKREAELQNLQKEREKKFEHFFTPIWSDDRTTSFAMALNAGIGKSGTVKKDEFTQQEVILVGKKSKKRKLIVI